MSLLMVNVLLAEDADAQRTIEALKPDKMIQTEALHKHSVNEHSHHFSTKELDKIGHTE